MSFFIYPSFRAVVSHSFIHSYSFIANCQTAVAFWTFLSSRYISAFHFFCCIVSVLINKIFIRSFYLLLTSHRVALIVVCVQSLLKQPHSDEFSGKSLNVFLVFYAFPVPSSSSSRTDEWCRRQGCCGGCSGTWTADVDAGTGAAARS